jgi:hypothetical protein
MAGADSKNQGKEQKTGFYKESYDSSKKKPKSIDISMIPGPTKAAIFMVALALMHHLRFFKNLERDRG